MTRAPARPLPCDPLPCDPMPCSANCPMARFCLAGGLIRAGHAAAGDDASRRTVRLRKGQSLYLLGDAVTAL